MHETASHPACLLHLLQFLLATNSAVLKQTSYFWEYYYSALEPYVHFWPFWETSPTDVIQAPSPLHAVT